MCLCEQIIHKKKLSIIDTNLTPQTAPTKGYKYVEDIPNLYKTLLDLLEFAEIQGYKIGEPLGKPKKKHFGLYIRRI